MSGQDTAVTRPSDHEFSWRDMCQYTPKVGRTTDPEALDLDRAVEMFRSGLQSARAGDIQAGASLIAAAFLLDRRSIRLKFGSLPRDPEAEKYVLDWEFLLQLIECDGYQGSPTGIVMRLLAADAVGSKDEEGKQVEFMFSLAESGTLIKLVESMPELENETTGLLHGCLSRSRLHQRHCGLLVALGNYAAVVDELTLALEIDRNNASARTVRAVTYDDTNLKDEQFIVDEFKRAITDAHPDSTSLSVDFIRLAYLTLGNPSLGTFEEACHYHSESQKAYGRYQELYGGEFKGYLNEFVLMEAQFSSFLSDAAKVSERKLRDQENPDEIALPSDSRISYGHRCMKCKKSATSSGGKLLRCGRCKIVSYCSVDCQREDWKEHKPACRIAAAANTQNAS